MSLKRFFAFSLIIFVLAFFYNACSGSVQFEKASGTSTLGNPFTSLSDEVLFAVCGVITQCNSSVSITSCQNGVLATTGVASQLGLSNTTYPTFGSVIQAEQAGSIVGNSTAANNCYSSITSLSCSNPGVQGAYNAASSDPYAGVAAMIPTSSTCSSIFASNFSYYLYVALNGTNNVAGYSVNTATGSLSPTPNQPYATGTGTGVYHVTVDHSGHFAYACNETTSDVTPYSVNSSTGALTPLGSNVPTAGSGCHYIVTDALNRFVYVANDMSNSASGFTLNSDGTLTLMQNTIPIGSPHTLVPDFTGNYLFSPDFSATGVTAGVIQSNGSVVANGSESAGSMPSQGAVTPNNQYLYTTDYGGNSVYGFQIGATGQLSPSFGNWSTGTSTCPHSIAIEPTGHYAYVANICTSTLTAFSIGANGDLTNIQTVTPGNSPHTIIVDPTGNFVYVTDNGSNQISGYRISSSTGQLTPLSWSPLTVGSSPLGLSIGKVPVP